MLSLNLKFSPSLCEKCTDFRRRNPHNKFLNSYSWTEIINQSITSIKRVHTGKLRFPSLVTIFSTLYGTWKFITVSEQSGKPMWHTCLLWQGIINYPQTPQLEDHHFLAVRDCLFRIFSTTYRVQWPSPSHASRHPVVKEIPLSKIPSIMTTIN
jgi:hypothetical protein